jgi:hypothetical protein
LLYIRVRFTDDATDPGTPAEAESDLNGADSWFRRISHGSFGFQHTITGVLPLNTARGTFAGADGFDRFITAAREAALAAGFDYRDFDLEVVRHSGVPGFASGNARLGTRGAQVQVGGTWILMHEIGHNLGLSHANAWDTSSPGFHLASPPLPSNYTSIPDPRAIPTHPESSAGHDSVTGPGQSIEYGDPWDIMGSGESDFSATYKEYLDWLPTSARVTVEPGRHLHRLHAEPAPGSTPETTPPALPRELRLPGPLQGPAGSRNYSVEIPAARPTLPGPPGLLIRWIDASLSQGSSLLLDGTPASRGRNGDATLPIGRTFSDPIAGIHVTPLAHGTSNGIPWVDVVAVNNPSPSPNSPPIASLLASTLHANPGEPVTLTVDANDPDADDLAFFWEFSDGKEVTAGSTPTLSRSWNDPGDHTVRVEVSDMRGGVTHAHLAIRVGEPKTRRATGVVRDTEGRPLPGVRVYSGPENPLRPGIPQALTWTDATGAFTLTGLPPGPTFLNAFHPDYLFPRQAPVPLEDSDLVNLTIQGTALPRIQVSAPAELPESAGLTNVFTLHRSGPTDTPLTVLYQLGGSASQSSDYIAPLTDRLVIPAGSTSATLAFPILDDTVGEPEETLTLTIANPVRFDRTDSRGQSFHVFYPGWELETVGDTEYWVQTRPDYVIDHPGQATIRLIDDDTFTEHTVSISASRVIALENPWTEGHFVLSRTGALEKALVVRLERSGSAEPGTDFEPLPSEVTFAPGEEAITLAVRPITDDTEEPHEEVSLRILPDPAYGISIGSASVEIRDRLIYPHQMKVNRHPDGRIALSLQAAPGSRLILESSPDLISWTPIRTNLLFNTDTASVLLPAPAEPRFYRSMRQ